MKKKEFAQVKGLDIKELKIKAAALKKEIADLVMDKNMKKLKDLKQISKKRKDVAQILTLITGKTILEKLESKTVNSEKEIEADSSIKKPKQLSARGKLKRKEKSSS